MKIDIYSTRLLIRVYPYFSAGELCSVIVFRITPWEVRLCKAQAATSLWRNFLWNQGFSPMLISFSWGCILCNIKDTYLINFFLWMPQDGHCQSCPQNFNVDWNWLWLCLTMFLNWIHLTKGNNCIMKRKGRKKGRTINWPI